MLASLDALASLGYFMIGASCWQKPVGSAGGACPKLSVLVTALCTMIGARPRS